MQPAPAQPSVFTPAGLLWAWWRGDDLPPLPPLIDFTVTIADDDHTVAQIADLRLAEVHTRREMGHRPYLACVATAIVGYGWSAANTAVFGSPPIVFTIPTSIRYLRDFATLPAWRGQGIYPRLLQAIIRREGLDVGQFWILHQWANQASARGIAKAGFSMVGQICFLPGGGLGLIPSDGAKRAAAGAALLGLQVVEGMVNS
jgi:GNAT superfamily N-acetyltransferase